jgi:tyrosinase
MQPMSIDAREPVRVASAFESGRFESGTGVRGVVVRVRKNVWALDAKDETLTWYARAVESMKKKPIGDPGSWRYQAAIHEYDRKRDPLSSPGDHLPPQAEQAAFWTQCQHGTWYFLPWHRMYLHHFEATVAAEVEKSGGPKGWTLPYWNYSANASARLLPPAFRLATMPDGTANGLYVEERDPRCNAGEAFAHARDTDLGPCLRQQYFDNPSVGGSSSFAGPVTKFEHSGSAPGSLELEPHGSIHVAVGGDSGWMGAFNTAALDPIFWLHHANIDRLWQVWLDMKVAGHANPATNDFLRSVSFKFHDATGNVVTMAPTDVIDSTQPPLSYSYDDVTAPLAPAEVAAMTAIEVMAKRVPPEMVGATTTPFELGEAPSHAVVSAATPRTPAAAARSGAGLAAAKRVFLNVENLKAAKRVSAYDVYLNVPLAEEPSAHEDRFVGRLAMFGLVEASRAQGTHSGSGLHYVLDVTEAVRHLSAKPGWDPTKLRVSFVPVRKVHGAKVNVGRVSLYVE